MYIHMMGAHNVYNAEISGMIPRTTLKLANRLGREVGRCPWRASVG